MITQQELKARLSYDPDTGVFTHLKNVGLKAGSIANCLNAKGYVVVRLQRKLYYAHRLAFLYMTGVWPDDQIDHINGVCNDNRWSNLREATLSENQQNTKIPNTNTSGFMGVSWDKCAGKWKAHIGVSGKLRHLGRFDNVEDAADAYRAAKQQLHTFNPEVRVC